MAAKYILVDVDVEVGPYSTGTITYTDISDYVSKAMITVTNVMIEGRYAFGEPAMEREISAKYDTTVGLTFETNAFGGTSLDAVWTAFMRAPLGSGTGKVAYKIRPASGAISATNPSFEGTIIADVWEPLGSGEPNTIITNERTFQGTGTFTRKTS